jgi:hypothetical protein
VTFDKKKKVNFGPKCVILSLEPILEKINHIIECQTHHF